MRGLFYGNKSNAGREFSDIALVSIFNQRREAEGRSSTGESKGSCI